MAKLNLDIVCKLCGEHAHSWLKFGLHLRLNHDMDRKEYYDKTTKKSNEGICVICKKKTKFEDMVVGYRKTCSPSCAGILRTKDATQGMTKVECLECHEEIKSMSGKHGVALKLAAHLKNEHNMTTKDYYDKFLKKDENEGICKRCGKPTMWLNCNDGYNKYCSVSCSMSGGNNGNYRNAESSRQHKSFRESVIEQAKKIKEYYVSLIDDQHELPENANPETAGKVISQAFGALTNNNDRRSVNDKLYTEVDTVDYDMPVINESLCMDQKRRYSNLNQVSEIHKLESLTNNNYENYWEKLENTSMIDWT